MFIYPKHPTLSLSSELNEIASPLFKKYNLNYFQYLTIFKDGSFSLACTHAEWIKFSLSYMEEKNKPAVYSYINAEQIDKNRYFFLWEPNLPEEPVKLAREFDLANGLCFVERYPDRYNLIAFASPVSNKGAVDVYLNHMSELMQFINNFKHEKKELIDHITQAKFNVPKQRQDQNLTQMLYPANRKPFMIMFRGVQQYVTAQEYACLQNLTKGYTYKDIARILEISPRTVESYLLRVKNRFGIQHKKDLLELSQLL